MKRYPSVPHVLPRKLWSSPPPVCVFDKLDGSNLCFDWSRKKGWHRFGTRIRILDSSHPILGKAMDIFLDYLAAPIERVAEREGWLSLTAFAELWGKHSLGGRHDPEDPKSLTLFDIAPNRQGIVGPQLFLDYFGELGQPDVPRFLGNHVWNKEFVGRVKNGQLEGVTFEGVVGKWGKGHGIRMVKAKTQAWTEAIIERYGKEKGRRIIES